MMTTTLAVSSVGVLATYLIDDLGLTRSAVGGLATAYGLTAAALSIPAGRFTDTVGAKRALIIGFCLAAVAITTLAAAPTYWLLVAALVIAGIGNSGSNPATNRLIARNVEAGDRGLVTGIKMSGVQLGLLTVGLVIPLGASIMGWRGTMALLTLIPAIAVLASLRFLPADPGSRREDRVLVNRRVVMVLTLFAYLMSVATFGTLTYVPLYAEEVLGLSPAVGGLAVAVAGVVAIGGRIAWSHRTEHASRYEKPLAAMAAIASLATVAMLLADTGPIVFWTAVVGFGLAAVSYNAAGTVALIRSVPGDQLGRASGVMFVGFLIGIATGPPVFGALVDATGTYTASWLGTAALFAFCAAGTLVWLGKVVASDLIEVEAPGSRT